ncbi:biotin transport system substrate-specific component [Arcanobacterium wilhelmae]|uniref:Biotin transporter n=1 Tax=Arcanobacterium wilhelmae TaxID=1803177 RepID=A0ABT9NCP7_9ACTO|nr:biotin transporter BioY [Arcanobacterium wilhelmae]MDP9801151.1 biotin transport system substrate-specific component [Arcanobacterium wilhelmae]WFN90503.1 biotin transporter BioY [Arcanobacterium wilhelmae]
MTTKTATIVANPLRIQALPLAQSAALVIAGAAVIALASQVKIPVGPVPITLQTLVIPLLALAFGLRRGVTTTLVYIGVGLAGAPVFAGGAGGTSILAGATFGYLIGMVAQAAIVGAMSDRAVTTGWRYAAGMCAAFVAPFVPGLIWLAVFMGNAATFTGVLAAGLLPFIPGELIKAAIVTGSLPTLRALGRLAR